MATFVDANVFIRFFANDDKVQSEAAEKLFQKARSGAAELLTGPPVFFEIAWVLGYRYKIKSEEIMDILESRKRSRWRAKQNRSSPTPISRPVLVTPAQTISQLSIKSIL